VQLVIWQQVLSKGFIPPTQQTSQHPIHVGVHGRAAALLVNVPLDARSVNWAEHGYYFTVGVAYGPDTAPLTNAQLIAVADGGTSRPRDVIGRSEPRRTGPPIAPTPAMTTKIRPVPGSPLVFLQLAESTAIRATRGHDGRNMPRATSLFPENDSDRSSRW